MPKILLSWPHRVAMALVLASVPALVSAETAAPPPAVAKPAKKPRDKYQSPLQTFMNTHVTTTVPPAQDFVRETHPADKDLDYTPLTGKEPDRPKPRDKANILALQAELESDGAKLRAKVPATSHRAPIRHKKVAE